MKVEVVERDFTPAGKMKQKISDEDAARIKGHLPFYSVDTKEEADALIALALEQGEFVLREEDGTLWETTLLYNQSLENLNLAGERLAALHEQARLQLGLVAP